MKPFVRWVGGKRHLAELLSKEIERSDPKRYVEPFLGGGAVALAVPSYVPKILADSNQVLIDAWRCIQRVPTTLIDELHDVVKQYGNKQEGYLKARDEMNSIIVVKRPLWIRRAALFLYLNARCFNGLWRTNGSGRYNVPFGKLESPSSIDRDEAKDLSKFLTNTEFHDGDYWGLLEKIQLRGSCLYIDPPYDNTFGDYTKESFSDVDQRELSERLRWCVEKGAKIWTTNSDTPLIREIYGWAKIDSMEEWHAVGATGDRRGKRNCLLIRGGL